MSEYGRLDLYTVVVFHHSGNPINTITLTILTNDNVCLDILAMFTCGVGVVRLNHTH